MSATTKGVVSKLRVTVDSSAGTWVLEGADPSSYRQEVFYERASGKEKTVLSQPADPALPAFELHQQFVGQFDHVLAVDTNKCQILGRAGAVAVVFALPKPLKDFKLEDGILLLSAFVIVNPAQGVNPETIGWHLALREHIAPSNFGAANRVALVVDSELGKLPRINQRKEPYYRGHLIPKNVQMIYASSDASSQSLPYGMIKACDAIAKRIAVELTTLTTWPTMHGKTPDCDGFFCMEVADGGDA
jgi:hypothetical protein